MYSFILTSISLCIFIYSNYMHFSHRHQHEHMIAFVGKQHSRKFEHIYKDARADLWVFGHRKRKSTRMNFAVDPFETFRQYDYKYMLLLSELHAIPLLHSDDVIEYRWRNKTIASLWPVTMDIWPDNEPDALTWYKETGGFVSTIHL